MVCIAIEAISRVLSRVNLHVVKSELLSSQTDVELKKICLFLGLETMEFSYDRAADHTSGNVIDPTLQMELRKYFGDRFDLIIEATRKNQDITQYVVDSEDRERLNY